MKELFISDIFGLKNGEAVEVLGWVASKRTSKNVVFYDVVDSSGSIQVVLDREIDVAAEEESVRIRGVLHHSGEAEAPQDEQSISTKQGGKTSRGGEKAMEIRASEVSVVGKVELRLDPHPRKDFDVFNESNAANVLDNRHLFLRNPRLVSSLKARSLVMTALRNWFDSSGYFEVTAPILSPILLYSEDTGITVNLADNERDIFLTQCVGFYLESAVHALERVYNIGPSFRAKETTSKRHLTEYWHVKSELAFCGFNEFFAVVESMLKSVTEELEANNADELCATMGTKFCRDGLKAPFARITYLDALSLLNKNGINLEFGRSLNAKAESFLSEYFAGPVWVTHNPTGIEGFPYRLSEDDERLTLTADLICSNGHGELLGIAEKTTDFDELMTRMKEKGKDTNPSYQWFKDLRRYGTVPHCGMGMGLERLIKWLFDLNHVRDAIPFPRNIGRKIYP